MDKTEKIFTITKSIERTELNHHLNWKPYIWILFLIIVHLSGIIIGLIFRNDCPLEKNIPRWEIINGLLTISFLLLIFLPKEKPKNNPAHFSHRNWAVFLIDQLKILIIFFLFISFIFGNIWVYKYFKKVKYDQPSTNQISKNFYCHKITYLYAFWYITMIYILLGHCLIYFVFSLIYNCVKNLRERK